MKKIFILICFFSTCILSVQSVFAASSEYQPTQKVLDYSLRSLRDSVKDLKDKNEWLRREIMRLSNEKVLINNQLKAFGANKNDVDLQTQQMQGLIQTEFEQVHVLDQEKNRLQKDYVVLRNQYAGWESKWRAGKSEMEALQNEINKVKNEIAMLNSQSSSKKYYSDDAEDNPEISRITRQIRDVEERIAKQQKYYSQLQKTSQQKDNMSSFKYKKNELLQQIAIVKDQIKIIDSHKDKLQYEYEKMSLNQDEYINHLSDQIASLYEKKDELQQILNDSQKEIAAKNIDFDQFLKREQDMQENWEFIKKENSSLRESLLNLEQSFQSLTKK